MTDAQAVALKAAGAAPHLAHASNPRWRHRRTGRMARASYLANADWITYTFGDVFQMKRRVFMTVKRFLECFDPIDPKETL